MWKIRIDFSQDDDGNNSHELLGQSPAHCIAALIVSLEEVCEWSEQDLGEHYLSQMVDVLAVLCRHMNYNGLPDVGDSVSESHVQMDGDNFTITLTRLSARSSVTRERSAKQATRILEV